MGTKINIFLLKIGAKPLVLHRALNGISCL